MRHILFSRTKGRPWRKDKALPVTCNGSFYSDLPFQTTWETSRGQAEIILSPQKKALAT